jgi:Lrp/AsnC family leucine-responsive transcriptional regulator
MDRLDKIDWQILKQLQQNAKTPQSAIAKVVGLSAPAVADRIRRLEDRGIIQGYQLAIDSEPLGYQLQAIIHLRAFVGMLKPFLEKVKSLREVRNCYRVTGNENIIMEVVLRDQRHLEKLIDLLISYGETRTHIVLSQVIKNAPIQRPHFN